jgi:hypothetical protein
MSVRTPFESLLQETARLKDWTFIAELSGKSMVRTVVTVACI